MIDWRRLNREDPVTVLILLVVALGIIAIILALLGPIWTF